MSDEAILYIMLIPILWAFTVGKRGKRFQVYDPLFHGSIFFGYIMIGLLYLAGAFA